MKFNSHTTAIVIGFLAIAGGLWYFFSSPSEPTQEPLTAQGLNPAQTKFATLVSQLQPIHFDTAIFDDPNFLALVDLTTPVTPEPTGRPDPFAPLK